MEHYIERLHLQTASAATTLPSGAVAGNRGHVLNSPNLHTISSQRAEGTLCARSRRSALVPPVPRILTWRAVTPSSLHLAATSCAASIAAYRDDSSRSALTFMPPVTRTPC